MLTQLPRVPSLIPSSFATRAIGREVSITIFTASSLNSGEKLFFGRGNYFTFPDIHPIGWTVRKPRGTSRRHAGGAGGGGPGRDRDGVRRAASVAGAVPGRAARASGPAAAGAGVGVRAGGRAAAGPVPGRPGGADAADRCGGRPSGAVPG